MQRTREAGGTGVTGGVPLAATVTGANRHDVTQPLPLVDALRPVRGRAGAPLTKPAEVVADRGYDSVPHRTRLSAKGVRTAIARRGTPHGSGLGVVRWVVERAPSWLHQARRLRVRYERRADVHEAFVKLRMAMICWSLPHSAFCLRLLVLQGVESSIRFSCLKPNRSSLLALAASAT